MTALGALSAVAATAAGPAASVAACTPGTKIVAGAPGAKVVLQPGLHGGTFSGKDLAGRPVKGSSSC